MRNTSKNVYIEYQGKTYVLCDLAKYLDINRKTLRKYMLQGKSVDEILGIVK